MPMPDFSEIKQWIDEMTDPVIHWSSYATTFLGIGLGSFVAWLQMPHDTINGRTVLIISIGGFILTAFMVWVGQSMRDRHSHDKKRLGRMMDRLERTCPRLTASGALKVPPTQGPPPGVSALEWNLSQPDADA